MKNKILTIFCLVIAVSLLPLINAETLNLSDFSVEVNGVDISSQKLTLFAGDDVAVKVVFKALEDASDVRIKVELGDEFTKTGKFAIINGNTYTKLLSLKVPENVDPSEEYTLSIKIYTNDKEYEEKYTLNIQRNSYEVKILDVDFDNVVKAGTTLDINVVLKNVGYEELEDLFVIARIPALNIERKAYYFDLTPKDDSDNEKEDSGERVIKLRIPENVASGVYDIEIIAYNSETKMSVKKKVVIEGKGSETKIFVPIKSKEAKVGEEISYEIIIVNSGKNIVTYEIIPQTSDSVKTKAEETIVAIPAGNSKKIEIKAKAMKEGNYNFDVKINAEGKEVEKITFGINAEGKSISNITVLTIILAIIFVVLLVVLIVLLTRKPLGESIEESYY